jgi:hypothetical protein
MTLKVMRTPHPTHFWLLTAAILLLVFPAHGQNPQGSTPAIQDNSFLVEEAYNQERGIVQHINTFSRMWNSQDWAYTFTEEFPAPNRPRHQLSYTLTEMHAGAFGGAGFGDLALNYRYQLIGSGETRIAFSPRLTLLAPAGDPRSGRGSGGTGAQAALPLSIVLHPRIVTHWNLGGTLTRHAQDAAGNRANAAGYNLGQSIVFLAHPRFNVLLETVMSGFQQVSGPSRTQWNRVLYMSPGIRWAYNFPSGLQIVPGVAMPIGVGPSAGERGLLVYLSFEAPWKSLYGQR